jgi:hypothetical protein
MAHPGAGWAIKSKVIQYLSARVFLASSGFFLFPLPRQFRSHFLRLLQGDFWKFCGCNFRNKLKSGTAILFPGVE